MSPFSSLACASVFYVLFFSIRIYLLLLHAVSFHQKPSHPICLSSISPHHQVKTEQIFSTFRYTHCCTWQKSFICARNYLFRLYFIFLHDKYLILLLSRYPSRQWSLVLLQGLVGTYLAWLPLGMMSFQFGCWAVRGKGGKKKEKTQLAKTEHRNANWLWGNPSGQRCRVCLFIS